LVLSLWLSLGAPAAVAANACGCPEPAAQPAPTAPAEEPVETVSTHVPLPVKTITVRDLKGVRDVADELDAAKRQEPQKPVE
jgi:hypothetical protein